MKSWILFLVLLWFSAPAASFAGDPKVSAQGSNLNSSKSNVREGVDEGGAGATAAAADAAKKAPPGESKPSADHVRSGKSNSSSY